MKSPPGLKTYFLLLLLASLAPVLGGVAVVYAVATTGLDLAYAGIGLASAFALGVGCWFWLTHRFERALQDLIEAAKTLGDPRYPMNFDAPVQELATLSQALADVSHQFAEERARRTAAEGAQKQSQSILADVQRAASIASWEWDIATGGILWSDDMFRLFRLTPENGVASRARLISLIHSHDRARAAAWLASLTREDIHQPIEFQILRADGESRILRCESRQVHDESGNLLKIVGTMRDITDLKRLEARLAENAGEPPAPEETVEVASLVGSAVYLAEPLASQAGVTIDAAVASDAGEIKCSERALKEILLRLVNHAIARSHQGGQVTVRAELGPEGGLTVEIGDSGPPPDADETGKNGAFAMARVLIEAQGGSFRLAPSPENGLTASLHLPAERIFSKVA
jgi:PAS domain S-box-containing protein